MNRFGRLCAAAFVLLACAVVLVPFSPVFPSTNLDGGWAFAVNEAVWRHLAFGRDLIFTFGPYASVYTRLYHPAVDGQMMWSCVLVALALGSGLIGLTARRHHWMAALFAAFLSLILGRDSILLIVSLVLLHLVCGMARPEPREVLNRNPVLLRGAVLLLVAALGLLTLVKGTFAIASEALVGLSCLVLVLSGMWRLAIGVAAVFLGSIPLFWVLSGQNLADLPRFFAAQGDIIDGYTEAMSTDGPLWQPALFAGCALVVLVLNFPLRRVRSVAGAALLLGSVFLLFVGFKAGFVRQDSHILISGSVLALTAWMFALGRRGLRPWLAVLVGLAGWAVIDSMWEPFTPANLVARIRQNWQGAADGIQARLDGPLTLRARYEQGLAEIRARNPLPALPGRTDIYSYDQTILLAHHLEWSPRPVLQSYSAYTPWLAQADASFVEGAGAPDNIIFSAEPIDGRLAALEDGLSWAALLSRYRLTALDGKRAFLRLQEGAAAAVIPDKPLAAGRYALGQPVELPGDAGALWATIALRPTLLGRLAGAVFKPPTLQIVFRFPDGREQSFRYLPKVGQAGFLISPVVMDTPQFLALSVKDDVLPGRVPASFRIQGARGSGLLWQNQFDVELRRFAAPPQPDVRSLILQPASAPAGGASPTKCFVDFIDGRGLAGMSLPRLAASGQFSGWGFITQGVDEAPEAVRMTLTSADGTTRTAVAKITPRPDVGAYFGKPGLVNVGFEARVDLQGLAGLTLLRLELTVGGKSFTCPLNQAVEIR